MFSVKRGNLFLLITLISYILGSLLLSIYAEVLNHSLSMNARIVVSQWGIVFLPILLYFIITKAPIKETILFRKTQGMNIFLSFLLSFTIMPLLSLLNVLSQFFVKNQVSGMVLDIAKQPLWLALLLLAVSPAIIEEISMRGIIMSNYRSKPVRTTCIISGFFFGLFHMNINQFIYAFAMGIILCFVVHITGSILSAMVIHFTINASSLLTAKASLYMEDIMGQIYPEYAQQMGEVVITNETLMMAAITLSFICLLTIPLSYLILRSLMKRNHLENIFKDQLTTGQVLGLSYEEGDSHEKINTPSLIASVAIFTIFVIFFEIIILFIPA